MPDIIDKREGKWLVIIASSNCPFLNSYPRNDITCKILKQRKIEGHLLNPDSSTYCCFEDCPKKEI